MSCILRQRHFNHKRHYAFLEKWETPPFIIRTLVIILFYDCSYTDNYYPRNRVSSFNRKRYCSSTNTEKKEHCCVLLFTKVESGPSVIILLLESKAWTRSGVLKGKLASAWARKLLREVASISRLFIVGTVKEKINADHKRNLDRSKHSPEGFLGKLLADQDCNLRCVAKFLIVMHNISHFGLLMQNWSIQPQTNRNWGD